MTYEQIEALLKEAGTDESRKQYKEYMMNLTILTYIHQELDSHGVYPTYYTLIDDKTFIVDSQPLARRDFETDRFTTKKFGENELKITLKEESFTETEKALFPYFNVLCRRRYVDDYRIYIRSNGKILEEEALANTVYNIVTQLGYKFKRATSFDNRFIVEKDGVEIFESS